MADKFNPPIIDDVLEELEEVEVVRKPPKKEPVIEDTLIIDEATPPPTKRYDIKRNGNVSSSINLNFKKECDDHDF